MFDLGIYSDHCVKHMNTTVAFFIHELTVYHTATIGVLGGVYVIYICKVGKMQQG